MEEKDKTEEFKESLGKCEKERDEYLSGWKRAKADFINYKKEENQRLGEMVRFTNEVLVKELIGVLDSFDLAIASKNADDKEKKGIQIIMGQLEDVLKKIGLERISFSVGQDFNPHYHEAVMEVESDKPAGAVIEEMSRGYTLSGKVIRPARVKLSKGQK